MIAADLNVFPTDDYDAVRDFAKPRPIGFTAIDANLPAVEFPQSGDVYGHPGAGATNYFHLITASNALTDNALTWHISFDRRHDLPAPWVRAAGLDNVRQMLRRSELHNPDWTFSAVDWIATTLDDAHTMLAFTDKLVRERLEYWHTQPSHFTPTVPAITILIDGIPDRDGPFTVMTPLEAEVWALGRTLQALGDRAGVFVQRSTPYNSPDDPFIVSRFAPFPRHACLDGPDGGTDLFYVPERAIRNITTATAGRRPTLEKCLTSVTDFKGPYTNRWYTQGVRDYIATLR